MEKIKVFVTGHRGFIGQKLSQLILSDDKFKLQMYDGDLLDGQKLENFFAENTPEVVIHLVGAFGSDFSTLIEKNLLTTYAVAEKCRKFEVNKIIYTSSGAVYKDDGENHTEKSMVEPDTIYGLTKKYAEDCLNFYYHVHKLERIILRFPNVYDGDKGKGVIESFIANIKEKGKVVITGDGTQRRDFLHVDDACKAIELAIVYPKSDIFNISSQVNLSLIDVVGELRKKYSFEKEFFGRNVGLNNLSLNFQKARRLLGYNPTKEKLEI